MSKNPLKLQDQMCFALYATSRAITKKYGDLLKEMDVTYPQYLTLLVLWEKDGLSVNELAAAIEIEGATMTPLVQRMEKAGLLDRVRSDDDNRRMEVRLTEKGRSLRQKALDVPTALGCALGVDDDQARAVIEQMNTIRTRLN
ncbi:MarR family transcriptional regulator [Roseobacter sp.]|uniref:MarR family winged helix-turn-helix transcriptional regulator n=1 Tax=Roseobacter sp. TaxID=1907202 RepID=UPI0029661E0B|nr:MarR family transcriptional regulator [Roseobacter sp.]MDW3182782.1 MarR family transcriptional regulator [Roseobacter sp.]